VSSHIAKLGFLVAILIMIVFLIHTLIHAYAGDGDGWNAESWRFMITAFIVGVTVVVVAIPEGLPLAVTISLAFSVNQMRKKNVLVRHLYAVESMGCVDNICSDKTGTLTQNKMHVTQLYFNEQIYDQGQLNSIYSNDRAILCEGIGINSTAFVEIDDYGNEELNGDRTECALLMMAAKMGYNFNFIRETLTIAHMNPFSSVDKRMSTMVNRHDAGSYRVYCKGAVKQILPRCTHILRNNGTIEPMTAEMR
jgi:Ca2+ transporting ATPase